MYTQFCPETTSSKCSKRCTLCCVHGHVHHRFGFTGFYHSDEVKNGIFWHFIFSSLEKLFFFFLSLISAIEIFTKAVQALLLCSSHSPVTMEKVTLTVRNSDCIHRLVLSTSNMLLGKKKKKELWWREHHELPQLHFWMLIRSKLVCHRWGGG